MRWPRRWRFDLIVDKVQVNGRAASPQIPSPARPGNQRGRLPYYNLVQRPG